MSRDKITDQEYIKELEKALIFICECYEAAKEAVGCREDEGGNAEKKYNDLWFHFPRIQNDAGRAVSKIAELRTFLANREANKMSLFDIFDRMHVGRKTKREIQDEIRKVVR